jgi:SpoVK/Ycf46/Vps4 family AAA+-type ATPase
MWRFAPFAQRIYIPLPEKEGRKQLLTINLRDVPLDADIALDDIAGRMDGYSGSDITNVLTAALWP